MKSVPIRRAAVLTACLLVIVVLAIAYWAAEIRLPDPAAADREGLFRWLATRDLREESPEIRKVLLGRLQEELSDDLDPGAIQARIDDRYRSRIWENALALIEIWYSAKVDHYVAVPNDQRAAMLDDAIDEIERWNAVAFLQPPGDIPDSTDETALIQLLGARVRDLKQAADAQRRAEITQFDAALRTRMILRALGMAHGEE